jgi:beta-galactosidase
MNRRDWLKAMGSVALLPGRLTAVRPAAGVSRRQPAGAGPPRERLLADFGWRFHLGHANDPAQDFGWGQGRMFDKVGRLLTLSRPNFDASGWRPVDLPHDWAVELPFDPSPELHDFGHKPLGRNFPATSIGWYRRMFDIPASDQGRRLSLQFDGVFRDAFVILNGHLLGRNFSGYVPARYDISEVVNYGGTNVLVVRVDATGREGWFYEGAGIYRHVWLEKTSPVHFLHDGIFVIPEIASGSVTVGVATEIENHAAPADGCRLVLSVLRDGKPLARAESDVFFIGEGSRMMISDTVNVADPLFWSPDQPYLYTLAASIERRSSVLDRRLIPFGIRSIRWDANDGFFLNGARVEIKGTCNHQDHAGVGSALPDRLHEWRIAKLKEMGSNAYRTAHNPPAPELLDACDRLGMLVIDETRFFSANDEGVSQLERMVRRDRNHPSIVGWSIANEEWSVQGSDRGTRIASALREAVRKLDPTRPTVAAMDSSYGKGTALGVDVHGINYQREDIDALHARLPALPIVGTETASAFSTRGIYITDAARGYVSAYDVNKPDYGATAEQWWTYFAARRYLAGGFIWTGFDYRGEPSPYKWPCISSHFGVLDTCGFPKDSFYYYQAWWSGRPVLHLFPHWNWAGREGQEIEVWCQTNLDRVELFLNGRSLGSQNVAPNSHLSWKVAYAPGMLEARGVKGGREIVARRGTTGPPAIIALVTERQSLEADGEDVGVVEVRVTDREGRVVPTAADEVTFRITGPARIIGVGNGDPVSHEPDKAEKRRAFGGLCQVLVQAATVPGVVRLDATAPGLASGTASLTAIAAPRRPAF